MTEVEQLWVKCLNKAIDMHIGESLVQDWLQDWFAGRGARVASDANYFEVGAIDSFGVIELIEAVESHFKIAFRQHDFQDRRFASIAGLAEIVNDRLLQG